MQRIEEMVKELPPDLQREVEDFVRFLIERHQKRPRGKPKLDWFGALKDLRDQYTSVELQHKIAEWRSQER